MQPNSTSNINPVPTNKHLALWTISFIVLLVLTLLFWAWSSRNPVGGDLMDQYNTELNQNASDTTTNTANDPAIEAIENDINSSLDLEVESDLKTIDVEF